MNAAGIAATATPRCRMGGAMERILVLPIGEVDCQVLTAIAAGLHEAFGADALIGRPLPMPASAFHPGRRQYHSTAILRLLVRSTAAGRDRVLGVIDRDLYVPELNFVFGEADRDGGAAVISLTRLRQEYYGFRSDRKRFFERAVKEAVHELGHTVGFGHCPDPRCIMHFSNSLADTDRKGPAFCARHRGASAPAVQ
jgi:archaemetzincin